MANIGTTTAFYKVETSLSRANSEVSKSMERLATGKQNANAGDRSSYVAMADTFRTDFVGTKAGIKGGSVVMGYLETGMRVLDAASALLSRLQELAVLAANDSNTDADLHAIDLEAEALGDEFHRLMSTSKYKGKDIFVTTAGSEYVSMGGRNAEMTFGIGKIAYSNLYLHDYAVYAAESDAGKLSELDAITTVLNTSAGDFNAGTLTAGSAGATQHKVADVISTTSVVQGAKYFVNNDGTDADNGADMDDFGGDTSSNSSDVGDSATGTAFTGTKRGVVASGTASTFYKQTGQLLFAASEGLLEGTPNTDMLTAQIEGVQAKINTARVQAGSQYAAIESAVNYTTDLTAQYELGFNTVNDVNFSMETAHLAKNQILQQAATAMLAQANQGQQGLLQLIQV
jgi:flagellin